MIKMGKKLKTIIFEINIIFAMVIFSALVTNEIRADKLPLLPQYVMKSFYREISLNDFQGELRHFHGFIFDARPHGLYQKDHQKFSKNFPTAEFDFFYRFYLTNVSPDSPIYIYGRTVSNAYDLELAHRLYIKGYRNITVLF
jgi:hypothetical protein